MRKKLVIAILVAALSLPIVGQSSNDTYIPPEYVRYCEMVGAEFGIAPEFLEAFIEAESSGDARASNGFCKGLMQVYEAVHKEDMAKLGITDIYDPYQNIRLGAYIIVQLYNQYGDDTALIVALYNGQSDAKRRTENFDFADYTNKVLGRAAELERIHGK